MKHTNFKLATGLGIALLFAGSNLAMAETVSVPATVTVNNAINFTFTGTLDFGTVRATPDRTTTTPAHTVAAASCAGLTLAANPATPIGAQVTPALCTAAGSNAVMQSVGGTPARPVLTIAAVAPFTTMNIQVPAAATLGAAIPLTASTGPGTPQMFLSAFTAYKTNGTPGAITLTAGAGTIQTDGTGTATFTVGATIGTDPAADVLTAFAYQDLAYSGSFDVSVTY